MTPWSSGTPNAVSDPDASHLFGPVAQQGGAAGGGVANLLGGVDFSPATQQPGGIPTIQATLGGASSPTPPDLSQMGGDVPMMALAAALTAGLGGLSKDPATQSDTAKMGMQGVQMAMQMEQQEKAQAIQQYGMRLRQAQDMRAAQTHALKVRAAKVQEVRGKVAAEVMPTLFSAAMSGDPGKLLEAYKTNQAKLAILGEQVLPMMARFTNVQTAQGNLALNKQRVGIAAAQLAMAQQLHPHRLVVAKTAALVALGKMAVLENKELSSQVITDISSLNDITNRIELKAELKRRMEYYKKEKPEVFATIADMLGKTARTQARFLQTAEQSAIPENVTRLLIDYRNKIGDPGLTPEKRQAVNLEFAGRFEELSAGLSPQAREKAARLLLSIGQQSSSQDRWIRAQDVQAKKAGKARELQVIQSGLTSSRRAIDMAVINIAKARGESGTFYSVSGDAKEKMATHIRALSSLIPRHTALAQEWANRTGKAYPLAIMKNYGIGANGKPEAGGKNPFVEHTKDVLAGKTTLRVMVPIASANPTDYVIIRPQKGGTQPPTLGAAPSPSTTRDRVDITGLKAIMMGEDKTPPPGARSGKYKGEHYRAIVIKDGKVYLYPGVSTQTGPGVQ